ncbi:uncharacterized protein LOC133992986 [Scomber scombrus]|uniref:uncharacterized protein LOC133992986 n=1 Tax=Scomber scombrus TaxID=13677 RepID=UPI002DD7AB23|nr:uncharacterized protein LOC133992986 [Scomber scombrus]
MSASALNGQTTGSHFDVASNLRLMPKFNENDVDTFFCLFERVADSRSWPDEERTLMLQCVFTGNAQEAYAALSSEDCKDYSVVKSSVLKAYELVPEAYRQRFRNWRKTGTQTHVEFARDLVTHFNRWCSSSGGEAEVGVRPELPVEGVDIILGNDLAGSRVWSDDVEFDSLQLPDVSIPPNTIGVASLSFPEVPETEQAACTVETKGFSESEPAVISVCAVTRLMTAALTDRREKCDVKKFALSLPPDLCVSRSELVKRQKADQSLKGVYDLVLPTMQVGKVKQGYFLLDNVLVRMWAPHGETFSGDPIVQIVLPLKFRNAIIQTAHDNVAGHMGVKKTYDRVLKYFFWPLMKRDVSAYVKTCHTCQLTGKPNQKIKPAPLCPIPAVSQPFEHLIVDCVGPLPRSKSGCSYLLTVMCQSTRYPAAYPLRSISAKSVVKALTQFISVFGIRKIVQRDQGSNFTSRLFAQILEQLHIKRNKATAYHPQSQCALERFHQHLKSLLRAYCTELKADWEEGLPWLLLAAREVVQESTGFSPNELGFAHTVRGPLSVVYDQWKSTDPSQNLITYVNGFRQRLYETWGGGRIGR